MRQLTINDTSWRFCLSFMHYACSFTKSHSMQTKLLKHMKKCQIQHADNKSRICASWLHTVTTRQLPKSQRWDMLHEHKKWCESWNLFFFLPVVWVCDFICIVSRYKVVYWEGILSVSKVIMFCGWVIVSKWKLQFQPNGLELNEFLPLLCLFFSVM